MDRLIHPEARVLVCDGRKALFLRNNGAGGKLSLEVEGEMHTKLPSHSADLGTDEPGRVRQMMGPRSSIEGTDLHAEAETAFIREALEAFELLCDTKDVREIVFVAPPRALATLRRTASKRLVEKVVGEVDKDLTKHPLEEIARILAA